MHNILGAQPPSHQPRQAHRQTLPVSLSAYRPVGFGLRYENTRGAQTALSLPLLTVSSIRSLMWGAWMSLGQKCLGGA